MVLLGRGGAPCAPRGPHLMRTDIMVAWTNRTIVIDTGLTYRTPKLGRYRTCVKSLHLSGHPAALGDGVDAGPHDVMSAHRASASGRPPQQDAARTTSALGKVTLI